MAIDLKNLSGSGGGLSRIVSAVNQITTGTGDINGDMAIISNAVSNQKIVLTSLGNIDETVQNFTIIADGTNIITNARLLSPTGAGEVTGGFMVGSGDSSYQRRGGTTPYVTADGLLRIRLVSGVGNIYYSYVLIEV